MFLLLACTCAHFDNQWAWCCVVGIEGCVIIFIASGMASVSAMEHPFYKPFYWGLDTVFNTKVKLSVSDILSLERYPDFPGRDI